MNRRKHVCAGCDFDTGRVFVSVERWASNGLKKILKWCYLPDSCREEPPESYKSKLLPADVPKMNAEALLCGKRVRK